MQVLFSSLKKSNQIGAGVLVKQIASNPETYAYYNYAGFGDNFMLKYAVAISNELTTDMTALKWEFNKCGTAKFFVTDTRILIPNKNPFKLSYPIEKMEEGLKNIAITALEYSPLSYILLGDTRSMIPQIKSLGAIYRPNLKHPQTGETVKGWIVAKSKREK